MAKRRPGRDPEEMQPAPGDIHGDVTVVDVEKSHEAAESVATSKRTSAESETLSETLDSESQAFSAPGADEPQQQEVQETEFQETLETPKIELNFKGSEILRAKFPKPFQVAEQIATEWVNGGRFEGLPLGHPLAQYFARQTP